MKPDMKQIKFRDGIVTFHIPSNWVEEYEKDGGGTFYEDTPDSGTLRLNLLSFDAPPGKLPASGYDGLIKDSNRKDVEIIKLPSGDGVKKYRNEVEEGGKFLNIHFWHIAHCDPPKKFHVAIFSWTILKSQSNLESYKNEFETINNEMMNVTFHSD